MALSPKPSTDDICKDPGTYREKAEEISKDSEVLERLLCDTSLRKMEAQKLYSDQFGNGNIERADKRIQDQIEGQKARIQEMEADLSLNPADLDNLDFNKKFYEEIASRCNDLLDEERGTLLSRLHQLDRYNDYLSENYDEFLDTKKQREGLRQDIEQSSL